MFLFSPIRTTWPAHLILLDLIIVLILGEEYKSQSFSLCSFLPPPPSLHLSLVHPVLRHPQSLFRYQVSHPYRTTGKIIVLYILICKFFDSRREVRCLAHILHLNWLLQCQHHNITTSVTGTDKDEATLSPLTQLI
jgi:hypothetical protein